MAEDESGFRPPDDEPEGIRLVGPTDPPLKFPERGSDDTTALPHWSEPATGEMPRMLFDEEPAEPDQELEAWSSFAATPRWRSSADDWDDDTDLSELGDAETNIGALDSSRDDRADVFVFDDTTEPPTDPAPAVTPIRTGTRSAPPGRTCSSREQDDDRAQAVAVPTSPRRRFGRRHRRPHRGPRPSRGHRRRRRARRWSRSCCSRSDRVRRWDWSRW